MKKRKFPTHETTLPENYREVFHIDATNKKVMIWLNLAALGIAAVFAGIGLLPLLWVELPRITYGPFGILGAYLGFLVSMIAYVVLHELTHGAAYKLLTKAKLTYGIRLTCAFCGVPDVYTYRRTALCALVAPLILFSILFGGLTVAMAFVDRWLYFLALGLFVVHISGCVGDGYMTLLMLFRYRDPALLMRDTGPAQWIYLPENKNEQ